MKEFVEVSNIVMANDLSPPFAVQVSGLMTVSPQLSE